MNAKSLPVVVNKFDRKTMEALICPQCGGQITEYRPDAKFTTCSYCATKFVIADNKEKDPIPPAYDYPTTTQLPNLNMVIGIIAGIGLLAGVIIFATFASKNNRTTPPSTPPKATPSPVLAKAEPAKPAKELPNYLEFGGKGTGNGLFQDAGSIAVDTKGRIYVSDDSLRVQQFDENGQFLKLWQIPANGQVYQKARTIDKIAVGSDGNLYVALGGVILAYKEGATEPTRTIHFAPDNIQDFALRSDGGMLAVSTNDQIETLSFINKAGKVTRRLRGFHTDALDAAISPRQTAVWSIRVATDGAGNIFSVYALGALGSYSINYNSEELQIARFSPDGKYVNKFVQSKDSCGIEVDNQSRIYVSNGSTINIYTSNGDLINSLGLDSHIAAFTLDAANNMYVVRDDIVTRRPAI